MLWIHNVRTRDLDVGMEEELRMDSWKNNTVTPSTGGLVKARLREEIISVQMELHGQESGGQKSHL